MSTLNPRKVGLLNVLTCSKRYSDLDVNGLRKSTEKENYLAHILTELVNSQTLSSTSSFKVNDLVRLSEDSKGFLGINL